MKYRNKLKIFVKLSILASIIIITFTGLFYQFDHTHFDGLDEKNDKDKFFNRFYFTITTLSSAGYGDITPITRETKILTILLQSLLILGFMAGINYFL